MVGVTRGRISEGTSRPESLSGVDTVRWTLGALGTDNRMLGFLLAAGTVAGTLDWVADRRATGVVAGAGVALVVLLVAGTVSAFVFDRLRDRPGNPQRHLRVALGRLPALVVVAAAVSAVAVTALLPVVVAFGPAGSLLVVPLLGLLVVRTAPAIPAIVVERVGPTTGLRFGWRAARGNGWRLGLLVVVAALALAAPVVGPMSTVATGVATVIVAVVCAAVARIYVESRR